MQTTGPMSGQKAGGLRNSATWIVPIYQGLIADGNSVPFLVHASRLQHAMFNGNRVSPEGLIRAFDNLGRAAAESLLRLDRFLVNEDVPVAPETFLNIATFWWSCRGRNDRDGQSLMTGATLVSFDEHENLITLQEMWIRRGELNSAFDL